MLALTATEDNLIEELKRLLLIATIENPIVVTRKSLCSALSRFITGEVQQDELIDWASSIELTPDCVRYELGFESAVATILFYIATPEINGELTTQSCDSYIRSKKD